MLVHGAVEVLHDYDSRASRSRFTSIPFCDDATILHDSILPALIFDSASCEYTILLHQELITKCRSTIQTHSLFYVPLDDTDAHLFGFLSDFSIHSFDFFSLQYPAIIHRSAAYRSTIY